MRKLLYPGAAGLTAALERPADGNTEIDLLVREILDAVREGGDTALRVFSKKFDGYAAATLRVEAAEIEQAENEVYFLLDFYGLAESDRIGISWKVFSSEGGRFMFVSRSANWAD